MLKMKIIPIILKNQNLKLKGAQNLSVNLNLKYQVNLKIKRKKRSKSKNWFHQDTRISRKNNLNNSLCNILNCQLKN
jgi:hypothetical protein